MYKRILIATDGSDKSRLAAEEGLELAKALGAEVLALYVVNEVVIASAVRQLGADKKEVEAKLQRQGEKALDDIKEMGEKLGVKVETVIRIGAPANVIIDVARTENIDCIVMGSHGESGVSKLLIGSVVQKVLYWATTPVLVVR
ncbi:MAG: universal stress protein [Methanothrix sp.]|jgi:nucleotide-binding universal stress UspA family protein|uniref:UspA domain protein n=1 Tax=Methanothrix thermoacetophila (strain DSM 6194 / JCM 14653 / NBRC 101360 / PT) TaxID=349307 RepID=A0B544_METTP|nr:MULTISPECIES: universal stress protein [Methanothrix]ABK13818.1 UspA domain protein [Methanothrix thermoacetophila PT]MBC7080008.1 universal stress protein [Methanothrix sp.]NPU88157.1 universal stress protein [Methanothrix sp.]